MGASAAIVLAPELKKGFCHYLSFFGFCGGHANLERVNKEVSQLDETVKVVTLEGNEKLHLVGHVLNHTNDRLNQLSHDSNENFQKLKKTMDHFAQLSGGFDHRHCFSYRDHRQFSDSVTFAARIVNFTQVMQTRKAELVAYKIGLHNFG